MKQKVVIKLSVHDEKSRAKAMKAAVGVDGVNSASLQRDKDLIEVTGEGIDVVLLTTQLRNRLKYAEVVSVNPVEEKKIEENKEKGKNKEPEATIQYLMGCPPPQYICAPCPPYQDPSCPIL
ncbi:hypothetical protein Pyn_36081 [Prunus yedoensis var. nudiflora]|uniref:HMA domain-containing protein n=1 Tax=Prunus yedoensis var. nudiflora TaxID=2094558 RepID=A0A314U8S5_PRUYE|nr:hypothetical protein Pyn_36081 [Prunus yedoensis var. nudiflora]